MAACRSEGGGQKKKNLVWNSENFFYGLLPPPGRGILLRIFGQTKSRYRMPLARRDSGILNEKKLQSFSIRYEIGMLDSESFYRAWMPNPEIRRSSLPRASVSVEIRRISSALKPKCIWRP